MGGAVNIAIRMESHGSGGAIQVTRDTHEQIKSEFLCEPRGTITVKGKGEMEAWHVIGPGKAEPAAQGNVNTPGAVPVTGVPDSVTNLHFSKANL